MNPRRFAFAKTSVSPTEGTAITELIISALVALDTKLPRQDCLIHIGREGNGIDIKAGQGFVLITGNVFKGFRSYQSAGSIGLGSGRPDNQGSAITASGPFVQCTNGDCVVIEGNDISDSPSGVVIAQSPSFNHLGTGTTDFVTIRRNVIHDLSDRYDHAGSWDEKGTGIRIGRKVKNLVARHNTFANTPGAWFYLESMADPTANPPIPSCTSNCCDNCTVADNVVSHAGNNCSSTLHWGSGFRTNVIGTLCAPGADPRGECSQGTGNASVASIDFKLDPVPVGAHPTQCGVAATLPTVWNYALAQNSAAINRSGTGNYHGAPICDAGGAMLYTSNRDTGAKEYCTQQDVDMAFNQKTGMIEVTTGDWYRASSEFVYSKGAYADALVLEGLPNAFCYDTSSAVNAEQCLHYTLRCDQLCGRHPNGEIDCSCIDNLEKHFGTQAPATGPREFYSRLSVDWNSDGTFDEDREPIHSTTQKRLVGSTFISPVERTFEWEDLETDGDVGDRNDFIASIKTVTCSTEGKTQVANIQGQLQCVAEQASCQTCGNLPTEEIQVSYSLSADENKDNFEIPEGRRLLVTVNAWRNTTSLNVDPWKTRYAVCPVLIFDGTNALNEGPVEVIHQNYHGGQGSSCNNVFDQDGIPDCTDPFEEAPKISLSKQAYEGLTPQDVCNALPIGMDSLNVDDSFVLEPAKECGNETLPSVKTVTFEVPWAEMERALPAGTGFNGGVQNADVWNWLGHLRIYVFSDIQSERFMCPSGVNIVLEGADAVEAGLAKVSVFQEQIQNGSIRLRE